MPVYRGPGGSGEVTPSAGYATLDRTQAARLPSKPAEVDKLFTLADVDPIGRWEGMIVGPPGSGKTVLAGTFPPPFRWLAADGPTCIKPLRWAFKEGKTSIRDMVNDLQAYAPYEEVDKGHYAVVANAFNKMTDMMDHWFSPGEVEKWEGGTFVVDSASMVNEWAMNLALNINGAHPTPKKPLSGSHEINKAAALKIITGKQDYKSAIAVFEGWISDARVLCAKHDRNLVLLCHEWTDEEVDEDKRIVRGYKPALYGQLRDTLPKSFDDVWYCQVYNGKEFKVQLRGSTLRDAKTRWGSFLKSEEVSDYRYLITKVNDYHNLSAKAFEEKYKHGAAA